MCNSCVQEIVYVQPPKNQQTVDIGGIGVPLLPAFDGPTLPWLKGEMPVQSGSISNDLPYPFGEGNPLFPSIETPYLELVNHIALEDVALANFLRKQYANVSGNTINYIAQYIEHGTKAESLIVDNVVGAIAEYPIAESGGKFSYEFTWNSTTDGDIILLTPVGTMDEIYEAALLDEQIPQFELARNQKNREFYEKLKSERLAGYTGPMVEFSPSPEMTAEAKARGYKGYDSIFVWENNGEKEQVTQYWLKRENLSDLSPYNTLCSDVFDDSDVKFEDPIDIMGMSGKVSGCGLLILENFVNNHNITENKHNAEVVNYALNVIKPKVATEILPLIREVANGIQSLENTNGLDEKLKRITKEMAVLQLELYTQFGIENAYTDRYNKFINEMPGHVTCAIPFDKMTDVQKQYVIDNFELEIVGCGTNDTVTEIYGSSSSILGNIMSYDGLTYKRLAIVKCPNICCTNCWIVFEGDSTTYKTNCSRCHADAGCN